MEQVEDITVAIGEESSRVSCAGFRLREEAYAPRREVLVNLREIRDLDGQMAESRVPHIGHAGSGGLRFDDLDHGAVSGFDEDGFTTGRAPVDGELEVLYVPLRKAGGIGRRDGCVFDAFHHEGDCSRDGTVLNHVQHD